MRPMIPNAFLLVLTLLGACSDPKQDKFVSQGGISPDPTAIVEGTVLFTGPHPSCQYENGVAKRVIGRVILTMFDYNNPPPPEGSATTSVNLMVINGYDLFQLADCLPNGLDPNYADTIIRSVAFSWPDLTLYPGESRDYQIRGFYDYDEDMNPFFTISRLPTAGDIAGAAVNSLQDSSKGFLKVTLPAVEDALNGAIVSNVTVALGQPIWTERPLFRLNDQRRLAADAPFVPLFGPSVLRLFRGYTCAGGSGDGVNCGLSLLRLGGADDGQKLESSGVFIELESKEKYAFYTPAVDIKTVSPTDVDPAVADGVPDPHPFLGGLGINWYQPMVLAQRLNANAEQRTVETAAKVPRVLTIGSVLMDDTTNAPIKSSFVQTPVPIAMPPVAAVELISGRAECRVPYFPPGTNPAVLTNRVGHCGELPTGYYTVNVLGGVAGGTVSAAPGYPTTSESQWALSGGRYSSQLWTVPNEMSDPEQVGAANVMPDQGLDGSFVIHDPSEGEPPACDDSKLFGQCEGEEHNIVVIDPTGADFYACVPKFCCDEIAHLCDVPLCAKVDTAVGRIASGPTKIVSTAANGSSVPDCIPFEMPKVCCP